MSGTDDTGDAERLTAQQAATLMLQGARETAIQEIARAISGAARSACATNGEVVCALAYAMGNIMLHDPDPDATLGALTSMASAARQRMHASTQHAAGHA